MFQHHTETNTVRASATPPQNAERSAILLVPDEHLCSRREAAELLSAMGLKTSPATLATWFTRRSDGPPVEHYGRFAKYQAGTLRRWALTKLSKPRRSSSEPKTVL